MFTSPYIQSVAVLISTYNWAAALALSVRSVYRQTHLPQQIVIADDGSTHETKELIDQLRQEAPQGIEVIHVWHEDKGFRAAGIRNKALSKITATYVIQIDGDCIMEPHFIADHIAMARPHYFIAGSRVKVSPESTQRILAKQAFDPSLLNFSLSHALNRCRNKMLRHYLATRYKKHNIWAARGANMSYFLADILAVNGYSEDFVGWGMEDSELAFRFYNKGIHHLTLKFGGIVYHLYHKERSREAVERLRALALERYTSGATWAEKGIDSCWQR